MFSQARVKNSVGEGACVHGGGACVVGDMCGRGHAWQGACMAEGVHCGRHA